MIRLNKMGEQFNEHSGACPSIKHGLDRTALELTEASVAAAHHSPALVLEEIADIVLTLTSTCAANGLDLEAAIKRKHAINLTRQWEKHPVIPGAVKHVKAP